MSGRGVSVLAVICIRDEETHVGPALVNLLNEGVNVVVLDDGSRDAGPAIAREFRNDGVIDVISRPRSPIFSLRSQMAWKREIFDSTGLRYDWHMHVDADEWLQAPDGRTLKQFFCDAEAQNTTIIDFDEFVFVPLPELPENVDPRQVLTGYYYYSPTIPRLMRAWKSGIGLRHIDGSGHLLIGENARLHEVRGTLRHYPAHSIDAVLRKYRNRRFDDEEVAIGWHANRLALADKEYVWETLTKLPLKRIDTIHQTNFDDTAPVQYHFWETHPRRPTDESLPGTRA